MRLSFLALALLAAAPAARAEAPAIDHREIKCIVAGRFPRMDACFLPTEVVQARVYFRAEGTATWFYVDMKDMAGQPGLADLKTGPGCVSGVLPKPHKKLVGKHVEYYVEASDKALNPGRTAEYAPLVVQKASECEKDLPVAPLAPTGPATVFPAVPAGFVGAGGGIGTAAVVGGVVAAGAVAGGTAAIVKDDEPPARHDLQVARVGGGTGTVNSAPAGIACGGTCAASFEAGTQVRLTAAPDAGSAFAGWEGACAGAGECVLAMDGSKSVTARFTRSVTLAVERAGSGAGSVTSTPAGIDCGSRCRSDYDAGTTVTLAAQPAAGSTFTGWSGGGCSGTGTCTVLMDVSKTVTATFTGAAVRLTVVKAGSGTGSVSSDPGGLECGSTCTSGFVPGTRVTLRAAPASGSVFAGWSGGGCGGTGECTVLMDSSKAVTATFEALFPLSVSVRGSGSGDVTSRPAGINCAVGDVGSCAARYAGGTQVELTATARAGTTFTGWGGDCAGTSGNQCLVTMDAARSVVANFNGGVHLNLTLAGAGTGTVSSNPGGINCPTTCSAQYTPGTPVTITAAPGPGSVFTGWSGGGCGGTAPCTVVMDADRNVTATFQPSTFRLTVTADGPGSVSDDQGQITNCTSTCTGTYANGATVVLTALSVGDGAEFIGWTGACSGAGGCSVVMTQNQNVTATFGWPLTVEKIGTGSGTVASSPGGINCGTDCTEVYRQGTTVSLSQSAAPGSVFRGWSGACTGTGACSVVMDNVRFVTADFELERTLTVNVTTCGFAGCGGTVTSSSVPAQPGEPRINCAAPPTPHVCTTTYANGVQVTLTAAPLPNNQVSWAGICAGATGNTCTFVIDGNFTADVDIAIPSVTSRPAARLPDAPPAGPSLSWQSQLEARGAQGQVIFNGQQPAFAGPGVTPMTSLARMGDNRVDARLQSGGDPGTWRFDLRTTEALEPGSLRVLEGDAVLVLPDAIVFRLSGRAGEQLSFTFRLKR
jgi:hypothetical protein